MYVYGGGEEKRKAMGTWVVGKKRNGEWGLRGGVEKKEEKNFEWENTKLVLFVCSLCLVQSVEL